MKLTYYFQYDIVSGVPVLFKKMTKCISNNYEVEVKIIDMNICQKCYKANRKSENYFFVKECYF